jgi:acyl carrier protein
MLDEMRHILTDVLRLGERGKSLEADSALLGSIPELDSMAVVSVVTVIEEHYGIEFDDDDFTAESFSTLGALCSVVERKFASQ